MRVVSLPFLHNNITSPKIERKGKKTPLTCFKSDLIKLYFYLVPHSIQRTFEQFSYLFTFKNIGLKTMSSNINKLLLQRRKNCPEIKASVLFIILGTIADNLLFSYKKQKYLSIFSFARLNLPNVLISIAKQHFRERFSFPVFSCTKNVKFHFWWGTKPQD